MVCKKKSSLVEINLVSKDHIFGLVELYAVVLARSHWRSVVGGRKVIYSRRSAAGSARTKVTRCHKRKWVCLICHVPVFAKSF